MNEFRILILAIPQFNEDQKLDKFFAGLKPQVWIDNLKSVPDNLDAEPHFAIRVTSALFETVLSTSEP